MKSHPSRRLFLRNSAMATTGIALFSSTTFANTFTSYDSPFDGYNPYVEEKTDLRTSILLSNAVALKPTSCCKFDFLMLMLLWISVIIKICSYYDVTLDELMSKSRLRKIADARNTLYYIFHKCYRMTSVEVGKMFNKNHATILSGSNKIEGFMRFDKVFRKQINQLINIG